MSRLASIDWPAAWREALERRLLLDGGYLAFGLQDVEAGDFPSGIATGDFNADGRARTWRWRPRMGFPAW